MRIARIDSIIVNVPYKHREVSTRVQRDGVTALLVRMETDTGLVGWGETCPGSNVQGVDETVKSAVPYLLGQDPWNREQLAADFFETAHWYNRVMTGNFAFAALDMAIWDLCGQDCRQPLYRLFGGLRRRSVNYFWYLARTTVEDVAAQARRGVERGYSVFYLKVGLEVEEELRMVAALRETIGPTRKIRIDANGAWSANEAVRHLAEFDRYRIDFAEQPVWPDPIRNMVELRRRTPVALAANEGLWRVHDVYEVIRQRAADVLCFSSPWVGTLAGFQRLSHLAHLEGLRVCRHTHGELGIMAAAHHHVCLTLPNLVEGNQQTAEMMQDDVLEEPLPIGAAPEWGVPEGVGLGVKVSEAKVERYHRLYVERGQYLPYQPAMFGRETRH